MASIFDIKRAAHGTWPQILNALAVPVPAAGKHGPCPVCGGTDRFHFINDHGGGEWHCRQCDHPNHGDGLELVARFRGVDLGQAMREVAEYLGLNRLASQYDGITAQEREAQRQAFELQQESERIRLAAARKSDFKKARASLLRQIVGRGVSPYLAAKGFSDVELPLTGNKTIVLDLVNTAGEVTGMQTITADGEKKVVVGSVKRGAFFVLASPAGDAEPVNVIEISEGLATGCAVQKISVADLRVCAIDAGNIPTVAEALRQKYPQARIIIAADNDWHEPGELDEGGKPKKNAGLIFAQKAAQLVCADIVAPPEEKKADWDDYLREHGPLLAAAEFARLLDGAPAETVEETAPASPADAGNMAPRIEERADGVYSVVPKLDKETGYINFHATWLCSPVSVAGLGRDENQDYLILRWQIDSTQQIVTRAIPMADIGEREGWRALKSGGVRVTTQTQPRAILADWLQRSKARQQWHVTPRAGWCHGAYILPDGQVIGVPEKPVIFIGGSSSAGGYTIRGSVQSWRESVSRLAGGNPSMMLAIATALAAPLVGVAGVDGFGIHLFERSSAGKTTTANVAGSLYGNPDALRLTWYGTALGIANEAEAHNDGLLTLDEVGQGASAKDVAASAYALFNGAGKIQARAEGGNRQIRRWRTVAISTGEMDIETYLAAAGIQVKAGQLVRLLNIPMEKSRAHHECGDGHGHALALRTAWQNNHGAAGREWVRWLAGNQQEAARVVAAVTQRWRESIPRDYGEQVHRVADRFAILEAALILAGEFTGWSEEESAKAIRSGFELWIREFGTGNKEHQQIIEQVENFLNAYGFSRFLPHPATDPRDLPIRDLAGYRTRDTATEIIAFHTFRGVFKDEVAAGFNHKTFARVLIDAGILCPDRDGSPTRKSIRVDGRQDRYYVLTRTQDAE